MKRWLIALAILTVLTVIAVLAPAALQAQEEGLSLASLAESLAALVERITALETAAGTPDLLTGIPVRDEQRCTPYNASGYSYPDSLELELLREMNGLYYSPYTDQIYDDPREVDIEHIVARSEAHDSGLCARDLQTRRNFARDLDNLTLASPSVNRHQKVDKDLAQWLPAHNRCWYVNQVIIVKRKYGLSWDSAERDAARAVLAACTSTAMVFTAGPVAPAPQPQPQQPQPGGNNALALYDDNGNGRISCAEARAHNIAPVRRDHPAYQYMRDTDGDGVVCE